MVKTRLIAVSLAFAALGGAGTAMAQTAINVRIGPPPPPAEYQVIQPARPGYVLVPAHWEVRGNQHVWVNAQYLRARSGYVYQQPRYVQVGNQWQYYGGHWTRGHQRGDRDRDGIPNRHDRDLDNDGVRNSQDRDRDGDGVPNHRDRAPDNRNYR
jgi:hypothetical protein